MSWKQLFRKGESPYLAMFTAGRRNIPLTDVVQYVQDELKIPLREKDIGAWKDGNWFINDKQPMLLNPTLRPLSNSNRILDQNLIDFDTWPYGWIGNERRWFPCNEQNYPMQKWGYSIDFRPELYDQASAKALSPCGWVGQNIYAQPFIVIDIDGSGHGQRHEDVISFGRKFDKYTETWENPAKPDSFHLYFNTPYRIPVAHFPFAKLDLLGNQVNSAVYLKNKSSNGIPRATLTKEVWDELKNYLKVQKAIRNSS